MQQNQIKADPTEQRYHIKAHVKQIKIHYKDTQTDGVTNQTSNVIVLLPDESTEASLFLSAWLPDLSLDEDIVKSGEIKDRTAFASEIGLLMGEENLGFVRGSLMRSNLRIPKPHIFIMYKEAEDKLIPHIGRRIEFIVLGSREEEKYT